MIDIHSHILPGVDDGAKDLEETKQMLELAYEEGIRTIIATPHYHRNSRKHSSKPLEEILKTVQKAANEIDEEFQIYLGNELFFETGMLEEIKERKVHTMAGSRYLLIEFSIGERYQTMYHGMKEVIGAGYAPIIAHVERYECLWKRKERIKELVELGCYLQVNARSLMGNFFNSQAAYCRKLAGSGLIHFISSDSHNIESRKPILKSSLLGLRKTMTEAQIQNLVERNPSKILENKYI